MLCYNFLILICVLAFRPSKGENQIVMDNFIKMGLFNRPPVLAILDDITVFMRCASACLAFEVSKCKAVQFYDNRCFLLGVDIETKQYTESTPLQDTVFLFIENECEKNPGFRLIPAGDTDYCLHAEAETRSQYDTAFNLCESLGASVIFLDTRVRMEATYNYQVQKFGRASLGFYIGAQYDAANDYFSGQKPGQIIYNSNPLWKGSYPMSPATRTCVAVNLDDNIQNIPCTMLLHPVCEMIHLEVSQNG